MLGAFTGWDYFVGLVFLLSIGFGLIRGLVRTVFALAGWLAAFLGTTMFTPVLAAVLGLQNYPWVAFILLFLAILIAVRLAGNALARGLRAVGLGGLDRLLGGTLGLARALIVIALAVIFAKFTGLDQQPGWQQAQCRPLLEATLQLLLPYMPERVSGLKHA